jgi:serine/threonine protein kinase
MGWPSTVKAKTVAGIVLDLRFAHRRGLIHGHLTTTNIHFDFDHCIQLVDFKSIRLGVGSSDSEEETQLCGFSRKGWRPEMDIEAFASMTFELLFGHPPQSDSSNPTGISDFLSRVIKSGPSPVSRMCYSFNDILKILKQNDFGIEDGVASAEVSRFVDWVESAEYPDK